MRILDLTRETFDDSISLCVGKKPGDEYARELKRQWLESNIPHYGGGKLLYENGQLAGMAEYTAIENSPFPVAGQDLLHINCVWVLPRFQKRGFGKELLKTCVAEARLRGKKGVSVIAYDDPFFMPSSFFQHEGFCNVGSRGHEELLWKDLDGVTSRQPQFVQSAYSPTKDSNKLFVNVLYCAQCPWSIKTKDRIERVSREFPQVIVESVRTQTRKDILRTGESRKIFVDGQEVLLPTPSEESIRKVFARRLRERE